MTENQHPLTETAAAELWDAHHTLAHPILRWSLAHESEREATLALLRAAFDAGRAHARETDPNAAALERGWAHLANHPAIRPPHWTPRNGQSYLDAVLAHLDAAATPETPTPAEPLARTLLGVPEGHGAPHRDAGRIKPDDYVLELDKGGDIRGGRAHHQDVVGDWIDKDDMIITWASRRADRPDAVTVWPAPAPPAVEVELPSEPCVLTDVQLREALAAGLALWTGREVVVTGFDGLAAVHPASDLTTFTLPDGTRARRDGEHANGEPRFVKEGEK